MKKRKVVTIYMTERELATVKALAKRYGLSVSALVRLIVINPDFAKSVIDAMERESSETREKTRRKE